MKIAVVGTGYVGLVTGTCFAETGNKVTCIDIDQAKIEQLRNGDITIYEPGLEKLFLRNLKEQRLFFTTDLESGIADATIVFLALPTPPGEDGSADLKYILGVANQLGQLLTEYKVIVDKNTVPVGTADLVRQTIQQNYEGDFDVISNPEFLREGVAVDDFMKPDRVVIGSSSEKAKKIKGDLYAPFVRQGNPIIFMDERSAELTKYASNAFLATKISFMNEIAQLCEKMGANVDMVRRGIGSDDRIGKRFLFPGIGYGGSCFPKDVKALIYSSEQHKYDFRILQAVEKVNAIQKQHLVKQIYEYFKGDLSRKHFAIWGLAFKPNTDDIRESPALEIIESLLRHGVAISVFDPEAMKNVRQIMGGIIRYADDMYDALKNADALIIATEWSEFRTPDFDQIKSALKTKVIFDGRNLFEKELLLEEGFTYISIGRP